MTCLNVNFFKINFIYLFIYYFRLHWVFVAVRGLFSSCGERGLLFIAVRGFLIRWLLLLHSTGSRRVGFSSCGIQTQQLWLMGSRVQAQQLWCTGLVAPRHVGLPGPGLEPVSPALAGGLLTTVPPRKPLSVNFIPLQCPTSLFSLSVTPICHMLDLLVTSSNSLCLSLHFPISFLFVLSLLFSISLSFYVSSAVIFSILVFQSFC